MATILLVGAGLLSTSFVNLATVEKGYNPTNVLAFQLVLPGEYPTARKAESIEAVLRAVRAVPGVTAAGFAYAGILIGVQDTVGSFVPPGRTLDAVAKEAESATTQIAQRRISRSRRRHPARRPPDRATAIPAQAAPVIVINKTTAAPVLRRRQPGWRIHGLARRTRARMYRCRSSA